MTSVEKRHSGHRKHRKHSDGAHSDTSSGGSFLDETDREVSSLTDRAFRSLCIGDEAVYNDSDLGGGAEAFGQSGHGWDTEALKRAAHERLSFRVRQYGEEPTQGGPYGAQTLQGDPSWEGNGERTERGVSATFQRSFVDMSRQEESQGDEQLALLNGPMELGSQNRRSRSRVSSLVKAFSSDGYRDANLREWSTNEASWDKSALMSIQRELYEFSDACHQNFNSGPFSPPGPFSSRDNNFYSSEMATAVAHMDSTSSFARPSHSAHSAFNDPNSSFFIHSEFSPFKLWRDHNRFPFQQGEVTGFMPRSEFPRWYETPMYKELSLGPQPPGPGTYTERGARPQRKPVAPPPPPRSTSTSSVLQKASALEKRSGSELAGQYPPWKQTQGGQVANRLPSQRPSTVSPTGDLSRHVRDTLSSVSRLQQKITMMTSEQSSVAVEMAAKQQGLFNSYDNVIPFSNTSAVTVEQNVAASTASSTTPFNISQLLTPVIPPAYQDTETLDAMPPPGVEHPAVRAESRGATPDVRSSYKSRGASLLFNLKDNRKRVKSTYSPPKFKGPEMADRSKQRIIQNANEPRDTIIDMPDFPDPCVQIPQVFVQEEPGTTDAALHQALQEQCSRAPPPAAYTSPYSGLNAEYNAREYLVAQMKGDMVPHGGVSGFPQGNCNSNQLNGLNRQEDLSPFSPFKMGQIDKREPRAGDVYGQASSERLGVYNTLPIATSPLTKHNISPKPFYSTTDTARSNIDSNSQNRGYLIAKTSTEQNASKSIFTNVDGYEQVKENRYGYNAVSYQDSSIQQAHGSATSGQAAEKLGVEDKPRPAWKGEIAAYMSEKDKQAQSSQSAQEQSWNDGTSYHPHKATFHAPYQPLASNNISNQLKQYANEPVPKDQSEPYSNQDPGTAKAKYEPHRAKQNEVHETKDNYPTQNYYPYGKMEQEYRKQQMFYSEDTKNTVLQETAQTKRPVPKLENEAPRLQQNDFKQQGDERDKQRQLPSSAEGKQRSENVLTNQITAENPKAEQIQADHAETEPPKTLQAEGTGGVQVGQPSAGSSGAELIIEAQPGRERHKAEDMKAERAMGGPAQQVKAQDYNLEHVAEKQAEEGASEGQTEHVKDKLGKAAPDETENNKQEQAEADNGAIQQQTQQSGVKQVEDRQADRERRVAENSYEVKEIEKSEAEHVEISQVTVEQAKVEQKKEELRGKIKTEHVEQAKEDKTRGELIEAGELTTNTEQTQTEQAKAQLARAEQAKAELSKIEKMKSESAKSKAKQADTEQVKLEPSKVEHAKTELAKARAELAKIKEKMRGEQKGQVGSVSTEEGNVVNKSTPEKLEAAENLKYQHNEDFVANRSDPVKADRGGDDYEHIREKYGWTWNNTDDSQKTPLVDDKVVEAMNNKESKDETNPDRIPIDKIGQEQSLSSTEYGDVRENQYVYSESSKEFKLSSANDLLTDGNRRSNNDTFNDKAKDDQAMNDNSEKREHPDHNISLSRKPDSAKPLERKPKDAHSTPYKALSYKERAQARQEILTSKIKAHAEKEISAIKEKGLSKNPPKHLVSGQGSHVRQKPPPLETSKAHDSTDSNNIAPKQQTGASETRTVPLKSKDTVVMREEGCILETQTTNKSECESEAIPEDSAPSLKLVLGQSEITTAGDDLQIMGIRVTVRERKPSVSDGQVDEDAHEAAKSKISPETQPLLFKQEVITRKAIDYTNKNPSESSAKSYVQDTKESQQLTIERTSVNEDEAKSDMTSSKCEQMDLDGTSLPVETRQDSAQSEETLHDENNSMLFISMGKQDTRTHSGEHSQGDEELHIDGIAIRVVPRVIEKERQEMTENHPAIKIPPSSMGAVNENKPATLPSPGTKTNTSKDEDRAKIFTPGRNELKPIKDRLEARHTSPSERQETHSVRFGDEHNAEENKQVKSGTSERPMTVEATTHARMDEDYFQLQGATETNQREAHLSSNVGNMSNAVSQRNEEPGAKGSGEIASLHPENKHRAYTPTQRQSKFSARTKTDEDVHAKKHDTESQPHSSATERQPANSIHSTRDDRMQENVNYKQKATPDISAIADYARLKVIAAEGSPDTKQDFHPGKKEGFFPLIQTRPSRRPVFTSESPLSAKENALPKEPEVSAKVSKEPKAVVFSTMEQEHKRTGMFRLGDKENTQGGQSVQQSHSHPMPASTSASHPRPTQGQTHNFGSSGGAQRDETRIKQKEEERAAKAEERRREALRQERLAAQREEEIKEAKQREAVRKAEEERRAKQREEDLRMKRMMEEKKAAEVEEARKAAQREEERRAKERQAITARLEEERRAKQRDMERKVAEEKRAKQREMERKAEEERKAKQREMERKAEEERKQKQKEMERKAEEERKAKQREMERKAEEERKAKQKEMEKKVEEERKAKQKEMERKAEEERKAKQKEMERKAEEERKAKQKEMERKAEEERKAKQKEMERKAEEERKAKQKEMERKAEEERKAKQKEMERKAEEERKAKQKEMERKVEEERKAKQKEMERKAEEERKAKQKEMERKAEEERKAKQKEMERKAEEERKAKQKEMERRAAEIEEQRIEEERRAKEREAMAAQREQERRAKQRELERREEEERRAKQREQERREEEERRAKQAVEEMRRKQIEDERRVAQREEERRAKEREAVAAKLEEERRERQRQAERRAEEEKRAKEIEEQKRAKQREEEEERRAAQLEEERRIKRMEEERIAALMEEERKERQRQEERRAAQLAEERRIKQMEMEEERRERQRKEEMIIAQIEEEERRAAQLAEERRIKQMEEMIIAQREEEERRMRAAQIEEEERRAAQLAEERRIKLMEEERRAAQIEEERKERQRKAQREEEEESRRAAHQEEEERSRASQLEEERKERQRMAARREEGERRRASQPEDDRKERQRKEEKMVAQIQEERRRSAKIEEEESDAKESEERRAKEAEEERHATQEKERRADLREERRDKRHAAQRTDTLQYYDINTAEGHSRPPRSPLPSRRRAEPPGVEPAADAGSYGRPHATPSPAPSASRSNASSPALGAKPTMFKVKDNTFRGASFTRSVKPRFHKNLGEDFRVGSPLDGWRGSQVAEDEQDKARRSAGTPVQHDGFTGSSRFSHARETSSTQDQPAPFLEHRPYARRSIALDEEDSRSILSNMSEDMESFATSAADLAELRGIYDYDRPESACSFSSDVARALGKPPSVPAKSDKALRRAKRLTQRRIKKESSKTDAESPAPEEKPLHTNSGVPSSFTELHSSPHFSAPISLVHAPTQDSSPPSSHARERSRSFHASPHHSPPISLPLASPHHSPPAPISLAHAPTQDSSPPSSHTRERSRSFHASPHHSPPISLPLASPHHSPPVSLPAAPQKVPSVPRSPNLSRRPAPVTQYQVEPGYSQNFPVTQRKVLQDPGSGQYFVVDMPVQVKAKTFFDPETGKYVQLNVRQTAQGGSPPQPRARQQAQPQQPARPQAAPTGKPHELSQGYPGYPQHHQSSLPTHRSSSGMSAASTLPEDSYPARQSQIDGHREIERGQDSHEHNNCSPEQTRYMDTACEPGKTRTTAYNTHNTEQAARSHQPQTNNTADPRNIITMSELEDFMDDW